MTFNYGSPPIVALDQVRFWSGDSTSQAYSISDEDIQYLLSPSVFNGNIWLTAAEVATRIGDTMLGQSGEKQVGLFRLGDSSKGAAWWYARAKRLRAGGATGAMGAGIFTGATVPVFQLGALDDTGYRSFGGIPQLGPHGAISG